MNILDTIKQQKIKEVAYRKNHAPIDILAQHPFFERKTISMKQSILDSSTGIIAEFKRKSPSKGLINEHSEPIDVMKGYEQNGVAAISCLTDQEFFGANKRDFIESRTEISIPMLRKEFIIDSYQLYESKAMGADAILLIAKLLSKAEIDNLTKIAHSLQLEVFLETHNEQEVKDHLETDADLIGINNRNLETFEVSIEQSMRLLELLPKHLVKIAESGLHSVKDVLQMKGLGFDGFLIGEYFMKAQNPAKQCQQFINELNYEN